MRTLCVEFEVVEARAVSFGRCIGVRAMKSEMVMREFWPSQATPTRHGEVRFGGDVPRSRIFDHAGGLRSLLLSAVSPDRVYDIVPEAPVLAALHSSHRFSPNKTPEPTPVAVMPRADSRVDEMKPRNQRRREARVTPATVVAHL